MSAEILELDGRPLTPEDVEAVSRNGRRVALHESGRVAIRSARACVERCADGTDAVYGVNTGFGSLSRVRVEPSQVREIQRNLVRSHAAGVGEPLPDDAVRSMMLLTAASFARGMSGVRVELAESLIALLNTGVTPVVPSRGSVGASGDLAPLSHIALVLIGEGEARVGDHVRSGAEALADAGLSPVELMAKEGLALTNGTHLMAGLAALAIRDVDRLVAAAVVATAMAMDGCRGTDTALDARLHDARRQPGQVRVASTLRGLLDGSTILPAHRVDDSRVQDPYSLRAAPQVLGAAMDTFDHVGAVVANELGAVTDNPLVLGDDIVSGGNFHGMPLAIALDTLAVALCHVAGIAERRIFWVLAARDSENPVTAYLSPDPGLHSGLMITQYTAAACCNEMQTLATPASPGNIPTSAGIEDYNSMGATAAHQAHQSIRLAESVVAVELLVMAQAIDCQRPLRSGAGVERAHELIRAAVPPLTEDRPPAPDIAAIVGLIREGVFEAIAESAT